MISAFEQIPPEPPFAKGGQGGFRPADGLSEEH